MTVPEIIEQFIRDSDAHVSSPTEAVKRAKRNQQNFPIILRQIGLNILPDQTGHAGEFLQTDGTTVSWQPVTLSVFTTDDLPEGVTNLYFTEDRARQAISLTTTGTSGASTYNPATGVLNIPQYNISGLGGVPDTRELTINGIPFDLSADRTWSIDLQSVLDEGNTAIQDMYLNGNIYANLFEARGDVFVGKPDGTAGGGLYLNDGIPYSTEIRSGNLTANRTNQTPNADGIFALSVNGNMADIAGNITITAGGLGAVLGYGAGIVNYLARWSDANTLTTGATRDDGTNVGIGDVPNSSYKLYVAGNVLATDVHINYLRVTGSGNLGATNNNAIRMQGFAPLGVNGHGIMDVREFTGTAGGTTGYCSYDGIAQLASSNYDHVVSFQHRPIITTTGTMNYVYGGFSGPDLNNVILTNNIGWLAAEYTSNTAPATVTNSYGFYAGGMTKAINNYGFAGFLVAGTNRYNLYMAGTAQNLLAGQLQLTVNGAASTPSAVINGTWFSGGSSTTTKPHLLIEPTGTTSTAWSTSGTSIGINSASGFAGNLLDLKVNNSTKLKVDSTGGINLTGDITFISGIAQQFINGTSFFQFNTDFATGGQYNFSNTATSTDTSGSAMKFARFVRSFAPTSGSTSVAWLTVNGTINQTGGASGITRGIHVDQTITAAANYRAIETVTGNVFFGTTSGNVILGGTTDVTSSLLTLHSTTKGMLPSRMTNAQRTSISSPATGLLVYSTDSAEGMYVKLAAGWQRFLTTADTLGVSEPTNQIVYGTGTGVDSSANFTYDGNLLTVITGAASMYFDEDYLISDTTSGAYFQIGGNNKLVVGNNSIAAYEPVSFAAATSSDASFNVASGVAPSSPANGDAWSTGSDWFVRLGGVTYSLNKSINTSVNTTDATVTTVATVAIATNTVLGVRGYIKAQRTGGTAGAAGDGGLYKVEFIANNVSGTVSLIGANIETIGESQAGWDVSTTVSGTNIVIQVTGAVDNNITWTFKGETF